ncbi:MAG: response regulator [Janthinobacterium lividum]
MIAQWLQNDLKLSRPATVIQGKPCDSQMRADPSIAHRGTLRVMHGRAQPTSSRAEAGCNSGMKLKKVADCRGEFALNNEYYFSSRLSGAAAPVCRSWSGRQVRNLESTTRVLIVDDYEPAAEALATALGYEGFDTRFAFSGIEALGTIDAWVPHVIVLDINMPEHDGFETASIMRRLTATRNLGIIAFTALSDVEIEPRAHLCGFDAYCQKGSPLQQLIELIDGIVV